MAKLVYPTFDISHLAANKLTNDMLNADRFNTYLSDNPHLKVPHTHSFYHIVFFTEGRGEHVIDFEKFPVQKGTIYFMRPGQVHNWHFEGKVDGYIVNFSSTFFDRLFIETKVIDQFSVFGADIAKHVVKLNKKGQHSVKEKFEAIIREQAEKKESAPLMIAAILMQLLVEVSRSMPPDKKVQELGTKNAILRDFQLLIENHFTQMKLPKDYAALLFITPHQLNTICKEGLGIAAGEVIRNRVLLEAKRLLINFDLPIGEISDRLNFPDHSYFVKFFKKYTTITPEAFRRSNYK
jgi:AraC-like DNA-binding protein